MWSCQELANLKGIDGQPVPDCDFIDVIGKA